MEHINGGRATSDFSMWAVDHLSICIFLADFVQCFVTVSHFGWRCNIAHPVRWRFVGTPSTVSFDAASLGNVHIVSVIQQSSLSQRRAPPFRHTFLPAPVRLLDGGMSSPAAG